MQFEDKRLAPYTGQKPYIFLSYSHKNADEAAEIYKQYYKDSPFVFVSDEAISLKEVVNTNKCLLHVESHNGYLHITSIIDNLLKGASGQAVENMNLMFGFERTTALRLKANAF